MRVQYPLPGIRSKTLLPGATPASGMRGPGLRRASAASACDLRAGSASALSSAACEKALAETSVFLQPAAASAATAIKTANVRMNFSIDAAKHGAVLAATALRKA